MAWLRSTFDINSTERSEIMQRRMPVQERAERTLDKIFQATAQIMESDDEAALSTNKIAAAAGVSIGTLYQYFPTKEAVVAAMVARDRALVMQRLKDVMAKTEQPIADPAGLLTEFIQVLVQSLASNQKLQQPVIRMGWKMDRQEEITHAIREMSDAIGAALARITACAQAGAENSESQIQPVTVFIVSRALIGVMRSASLEKSSLLGSKELEAELVRLAGLMTAAT